MYTVGSKNGTMIVISNTQATTFFKVEPDKILLRVLSEGMGSGESSCWTGTVWWLSGEGRYILSVHWALSSMFNGSTELVGGAFVLFFM